MHEGENTPSPLPVPPHVPGSFPQPESLAPPPPPVFAPAVITDTPCIGCGYNIRSLELSVRCPECGTPVQATLSGGLRYAPEAYLRRMLLATRCLSYGMLGYAAAFVLIGVAAAIMDALSSSSTLFSSPASAVGGGVMLSTLIGTLPVVVMLLGYWLLTTAHPGMPPQRQPTTARSLTRVAVGLAGAVCLSSAISTIVAATRTGVTANAMAATGMLWYCGGCVGFPLLLGLVLPPVRIVTWLCEIDRSPESGVLARRAKISYWLLPLLIFVGPLLGYGMFMVILFTSISVKGGGPPGGGVTAPPDDTLMIIAMVGGCGTAIGSMLAAMIYTWYVAHATGKLLRGCLAARESEGTGTHV